MLFFFLAAYCTFLPPSGWEIAQLKTPSPHVKIGFLGKGSGEFRPSINLATEEVDVSLNQYVQAVKELHLNDPKVQWSDLGKIQMKSGVGKLIQMTQTTPYGDIKILQAFFVKNQTAYILTAAALKEDFPKLQNEMFRSLQSLDLIDQLSASITNPKERAAFESFFASLGSSEEKQSEWEELQAQVKENGILGPYWQFLVLQEGRAKIYPNQN